MRVRAGSGRPGWGRVGVSGVMLLVGGAALGVCALRGVASADASTGAIPRASDARESAPEATILDRATSVGTDRHGDRGEEGVIGGGVVGGAGVMGVVTSASFRRQAEATRDVVPPTRAGADQERELTPTPGALALAGVAVLAAFRRRGGAS